jgi:steroid delta-isomerase-like uncharacterized protein
VATGKDLWNEAETLGNLHDWAGVALLYARDAVYSTPTGRHEGSEAIQAAFEAADKAFPDQTAQTSLVVEDGDVVAAEWTWQGTFTGAMTMPDGTEIAATGKAVELPAVNVATVTDGKFTTMREYYDNAAGMTQLGLMPST